MSIEHAKEFVHRMKTDRDFARKVLCIESKQERLEFASSMGFHFTQEEIQGVKTSLSDEELDLISAGKSSCSQSQFETGLQMRPPEDKRVLL